MASLSEIAELAWRQMYPGGGDETPVTLVEFIETAKHEAASQWWLKAMQEKREDGYFEVPTNMLVMKEMEVSEDGVIDISGLQIMRSIPNEKWLQNLGGLACKCKYVKSTVNHTQLLCDDDSLDDQDKTYLVIGKEIHFPKGVHSNTMPIIYASNGEGIDGDIEVDDAIGGIVRSRLIEIYGGKTGREDETNNSNSTT